MVARAPSWNDLRIFLEVARCGNLSAAARRLRVDVSTISRHIAHLEVVLTTPVFERSAQGLRITPRGQALLEHVEAMERHAQAVNQVLEGRQEEPAGSVRLGTMEGIASLYLAGQLVALSTRYPLVHVELVTSTQTVHVSQREADLFLSFFPAEGRGLDVTPVGQFSLDLYAAPAYLETRGVPGNVAELARHDFVSYIDDLVQLDTVRWLNEVIAFPHTVFHSTSMLAQLFSAAAGGGIVMLPSFSGAERFGLVRVLESEIQVKRTVWMTVHRDLQYLPKIKVVTAYLKEILKRDHPLPPGVRESAS